MKKIGIILAVIVLLALASWLMWNKSDQPTQSTQGNNNATQTTDVRLTGTIQTVVNQQPVDGNLRVKVNDTWIIIGGGEMPVPNPGVVTGFDFNNVEVNVGKKAEVYAKRTGYDQGLTILEDSKYYLKIVQ